MPRGGAQRRLRLAGWRVGSSSVRGADGGGPLARCSPQGGSRGRPSEVAETRRRLRTDDFRRELLRTSAGMLSLSADHAEVFYPNLDAEFPEGEGTRGEDGRGAPPAPLSPVPELACELVPVRRAAPVPLLLQSGGEQAREADGRSDQRPRQQPERIKIVGYDARVRHAYKCLAVAVLSHWDESSTNEEAGASESSARATRKFEALEDAVVSRLAAQPERDPSCR